MKKLYSIFTVALFSMALFQNAYGQAQIVASPDCGLGVGVVNLRDVPGPTGGRCFVSVTAPLSFDGYSITIYSGLGTNLTEVAIISGGLMTPSPTNTTQSIGSVEYSCAFGEISYIGLQNGPTGSLCFTPTALSISLPIKLTAFNATLNGNTSVVLNWTSEFEANSSHFGIEKSNDGKNFSTISTVKAAGMSLRPLKYSFTDANFTGTGFYRLKLVDLDGRAEYSKTVYVNGGSGSANGTLSVFPNPFRSDVQLKGINASDVNKSSIRVFNATGKEVGFKVSGSNSITIDPSLPRGIYIIRVKDQNFKLVKEN
jgi:type IX secretion system substrate protein